MRYFRVEIECLEGIQFSVYVTNDTVTKGRWVTNDMSKPMVDLKVDEINMLKTLTPTRRSGMKSITEITYEDAFLEMM